MQEETGWLIELPFTAHCGGTLCYVALNGVSWPRFATKSKLKSRLTVQECNSPLRFTTDSNEALRFARRQDAEAFVVQFSSFLIEPVVSEHQWLKQEMQ